jgi:hypothetical protein
VRRSGPEASSGSEVVEGEIVEPGDRPAT